MSSVALNRKCNVHDRRISHGRAQASTRRDTTTVVGATTVGTKRDISERFRKHFEDVPHTELAQGAEVTKEAARLWVTGERTIDLASALKLARNTREGKYWMLSEIGEFDSPQLIAKLLAALDK
jgi:hypothetical protein